MNPDENKINPKVTEYISRFAPNGFDKPNWPSFFTQMDLESYHQILPYIFGIELFNLRLLKALLSEDRICIYSDYDTDAVTATATMYHGLVELGFNPDLVNFYAPDRFTEGYGMNVEAVDELSKNYDLIISVDCGINSREEADLIQKAKLTNYNKNEHGLDTNNEPYSNSGNNITLKIADLIITDHHQLVGSIPDALAVVNPRLNSLYAGDPELLNNLKLKIENEKLSLFNWMSRNKILLDNRNLDLEKLNNKITDSIEKTEHNPKTFNLKSLNYLTSSATGGGVAWFCLVLFGYFL